MNCIDSVICGFYIIHVCYILSTDHPSRTLVPLEGTDMYLVRKDVVRYSIPIFPDVSVFRNRNSTNCPVDLSRGIVVRYRSFTFGTINQVVSPRFRSLQIFQ